MHKLKTSAKANLKLLVWAIKLSPKSQVGFFWRAIMEKLRVGGFFYPHRDGIVGFIRVEFRVLRLTRLKEKPKKPREGH